MKGLRKGVTLIELVISLALVGIIIQVVYSIFFVGNTSYSISANKGFSQQDVRLLGDFLSSELKYITDISTTDEDYLVGEYYSIRIKNEEDKKVLVKTLHKYEDEVLEETETKKIYGNWKSIIFSNIDEGEIDIYISQEEGKGNQKSSYNLPLKLITVNKRDLMENFENIDLVEGGIIYYRNNRSDLLTSGIDIGGEETGEDKKYTIELYNSIGVLEKTITDKYGQKVPLPNPVEQMEGKFFVGWNTKSDGTGASHLVEITISGDLKLYAQWSDTKPIEGVLYDLKVIEVEYEKGGKWETVRPNVNPYIVGNKHKVKITVSFGYTGTSMKNLEMIVMGKNTGGISEKDKIATIEVDGPSDSTNIKEVEIEIREKDNHNKSIKKIVTLKKN